MEGINNSLDRAQQSLQAPRSVQWDEFIYLYRDSKMGAYLKKDLKVSRVGLGINSYKQ